MEEQLFDFIGLCGVFGILIAYFLLQTEKVRAHSPTYLLFNLFGALLIIVSLLWSWNLAAFLLELCWVAISLYGLIKHYRKAT